MEINELLVDILRVVIIAAIIFFTRYCIPALKSYISSSNYALVASVVQDAVEQAEQIIKKEKAGSEKKEFVKATLSKIFEDAGIHITEDQIDSLIESAVFAMNTSKSIS